MTDYKPKIVSLFSGCGGMDLGFRAEGYETVWANDFFKEAVLTYKKNIGEEIVLGDITKIDPYTDESIPDCDLVVGGFPCQDFSIIGQRKGLHADRGNLFKNLAQFIDAKKPKAFVAENVPGILSANKGAAVEYILDTFRNIQPGYVVQYKVINFADYGVPQTRKRCIFVGVRADIDFNFRFPDPTHGKNADRPWVTAGEALDGVEKIVPNNELHESSKREKAILELIPPGGNWRCLPSDHPYNGTASGYGNMYSRSLRDRPAFTLTATGGGGQPVIISANRASLPIVNGRGSRLSRTILFSSAGIPASGNRSATRFHRRGFDRSRKRCSPCSRVSALKRIR